MKDFLSKKDKHIIKYADAVMSKYRSLKYGINSCCHGKDLDLLTMRFELTEWQAALDYSALSERVRINYLTWLPISVEHEEMHDHHQHGSCYSEQLAPNSASMAYTYGGVHQNIIEVNAGGCITRINVNPEITINENGGAVSYHITPAQAVWSFTHGLGFNPNITTTDENGQEIVGVVDYVSSNSVTITFSQPVAGYAYLS
jgi:hypothetical protein